MPPRATGRSTEVSQDQGSKGKTKAKTYTTGTG